MVLVILLAFSQRTSAQGAITGAVRYYSTAAAVPDVAVRFTGVAQTTHFTNEDGSYVFTDPGTSSCAVEPGKLGDLNGAVSPLDATWVLQAVVGLRQFNANQMLACDVTGDGTVSSLDAARILQLVAGVRSRFPSAEACGSDWVFVPAPLPAPNQHVISPQMAPLCSPGGIVFESIAEPVAGQDFIAAVFGDCTGNWAVAAPPPDTPMPSNTATATRTFSSTATGTRTPTATRTSTPPATSTPTAPPAATATQTRTASSTRTATSTRSLTPTWTPLATSTQTRTYTASRTSTRTPPATATRTATNTATRTPTRTGTRTATPSSTGTSVPTPTATCANGLAWGISGPTLVSAQSGGSLWLAKTVPTDSGWGIFWLRNDPGASNSARLYYAHISFDRQITVAPMLLLNIPKISFRGHYYFAAWNVDHYGLLIANQATLQYYNLTIAGALSGPKVVGPPLFTSTVFDQESAGDIDPYPNGFFGVVEGVCAGHSCSYAFKLDLNGNPVGAPINLVDFDLTHQFYPRAAFDGTGFAVLSVKDITIPNGGVMTKYVPPTGTLSNHAKVVPSKEYLWDEFPDIAWNGDHFAAVWTENSARSHNEPWQIHFASFRRTKPTSTLIADRVIDVVENKTNHRWTTQIHAAGSDWVAQYASRAADNSVIAIYELLGDNGQTRAALEPFTLTADALGSSPHTAAGQLGTLGIARGSNLPQGTEVTFYTLPAPACTP
jgi:hypothetical protein